MNQQITGEGTVLLFGQLSTFITSQFRQKHFYCENSSRTHPRKSPADSNILFFCAKVSDIRFLYLYFFFPFIPLIYVSRFHIDLNFDRQVRFTAR